MRDAGADARRAARRRPRGDRPRRRAGGRACEEEIDRWCRLLETVDPVLAPGWDGVGRRAAASGTAADAAAVVHGDFRLGNLLAVGADVTAVIDWEIWTVGDPRVDVGWFLVNADPATYRRADSVRRRRCRRPRELLDVYADALGRDVADVEWFQALACFKSTATWSLIVKHNRRRAEPDPDVEAMAPPARTSWSGHAPADLRSVRRQRRGMPCEPVGDLGLRRGSQPQQVLGREAGRAPACSPSAAGGPG